ncbi:MAG: AraC family transcriptional regulator [Planctomycetes bacterium]|nr:AraC family transcriptional regulator [Planctomycetota bacterium]
MPRFFGPHLPQVAHFHAHERPLPEFPALTHVHEAICAPAHFLAPHTHEIYELCYIHAGRGEWHAGGRNYPLQPGDLYITKPGEVHGGRTDPADPFHLYVVGLDPAALPLMDRVPKLKALDAPTRDVAQAVDEAAALEGGFSALDQKVIPGAQGIERIYRRLLAELDAECAGDFAARGLRLLMVQALLVELLVFAARLYAARTSPSKLEAGGGNRPLDAGWRAWTLWISSRLADPPSLQEMADRAGLSPAHFAVRFKEQTGQTPLEYVTAARVEAAAQRLARDPSLNVTEAALDLGFSSSQYFSVVFRKLKGCSPSEWRGKHVT